MLNRVRKQLQVFSLSSQGEAFQVSVPRHIPHGSSGGLFAHVMLPARKLFVIEYISAYIRLPEGQEVEEVGVITYVRGVGDVRHRFLATHTACRIWTVSQQTRLYAHTHDNPLDPPIVVGIERHPLDDDAYFDIALSGLLLTRRPIVSGEPAPPDGPKAP